MCDVYISDVIVYMKWEDYTCFTKNPPFVKGIDKEDGWLCDCHEEVADGQVHDEIVWGRP